MLEAPVDKGQIGYVENFIAKWGAKHEELVQPWIRYFITLWLLFVLSLRHRLTKINIEKKTFLENGDR